MSNHEELNEQHLTAIELDDAKDDRRSRRLTKDEQLRGIAAVAKWPKERRDELLLMEANERNLMLLLAGSLGAVPERKEAPD